MRKPKRTIRTAKSLRKSMTDAEKRLWNAIKNRQIEGRKFRRQHPVSSYILDFVCIEAKLAIEVDGGQHAERTLLRDRKRTVFLEAGGWVVVRFWNNEVLQNLNGVLESIKVSISEQPLASHPLTLPSPPPFSRGRRLDEGDAARRRS